MLQVGERVRLVADPSVVGVVVSVMPGESSDRVVVFHDQSRTSTYYLEQVEAIPDEQATLVVDRLRMGAVLTSRQLLHPSTQYLYSLFSPPASISSLTSSVQCSSS